MNWFTCNSCPATFHEDESPIRGAYNPDARRTLHFHTCPDCGSDDLAEAFECDYCGEHFAAGDMIDGTDCCKGCEIVMLSEECEPVHGIDCRHP